MQRGHRVASLEPQPRLYRRRVEAIEVGQQRVDHGVAHEDHATAADALTREVLLALGRGHVERVAEDVGDPPVDLLGHGVVERAQPGFHVRDGDPQLGAGQGRRQRGVDVAVDDHALGRLLAEDLLQGHQQRRGLGPVCAGAHAEVEVGLGQTQLLEEDLRHAPVVVLTGVDDLLLGTGRLERGDDGRGLDEVRPGADDVDESGHGARMPSPRLGRARC